MSQKHHKLMLFKHFRKSLGFQGLLRCICSSMGVIGNSSVYIEIRTFILGQGQGLIHHHHHHPILLRPLVFKTATRDFKLDLSFASFGMPLYCSSACHSRSAFTSPVIGIPVDYCCDNRFMSSPQHNPNASQQLCQLSHPYCNWPTIHCQQFRLAKKRMSLRWHVVCSKESFLSLIIEAPKVLYNT